MKSYEKCNFGISRSKNVVVRCSEAEGSAPVWPPVWPKIKNEKRQKYTNAQTMFFRTKIKWTSQKTNNKRTIQNLKTSAHETYFGPKRVFVQANLNSSFGPNVILVLMPGYALSVLPETFFFTFFCRLPACRIVATCRIVAIPSMRPQTKIKHEQQTNEQLNNHYISKIKITWTNHNHEKIQTRQFLKVWTNRLINKNIISVQNVFLSR